MTFCIYSRRTFRIQTTHQWRANKIKKVLCGNANSIQRLHVYDHIYDFIWCSLEKKPEYKYLHYKEIYELSYLLLVTKFTLHQASLITASKWKTMIITFRLVEDNFLLLYANGDLSAVYVTRGDSSPDIKVLRTVNCLHSYWFR